MVSHIAHRFVFVLCFPLPEMFFHSLHWLRTIHTESVQQRNAWDSYAHILPSLCYLYTFCLANKNAKCLHTLQIVEIFISFAFYVTYQQRRCGFFPRRRAVWERTVPFPEESYSLSLFEWSRECNYFLHRLPKKKMAQPRETFQFYVWHRQKLNENFKLLITQEVSIRQFSLHSIWMCVCVCECLNSRSCVIAFPFLVATVFYSQIPTFDAFKYFYAYFTY